VFDIIVGLTLLSYAVNLFIFLTGRLRIGSPPIVDGRLAPTLAGYADPLPQALVLTAIVISFAMTALLLVIALRANAETASDHVDGASRWRGGRERAVNWPHWIVVPVVLPLAAGAALLLIERTCPALAARCRSPPPRHTCWWRSAWRHWRPTGPCAPTCSATGTRRSASRSRSTGCRPCCWR